MAHPLHPSCRLLSVPAAMVMPPLLRRDLGALLAATARERDDHPRGRTAGLAVGDLDAKAVQYPIIGTAVRHPSARRGQNNLSGAVFPAGAPPSERATEQTTAPRLRMLNACQRLLDVAP